jgi:hypothetical protein
MLDRRKEAVYCDRRCKELAREKRRRGRARVDALRAKYPDADISLADDDEHQGDEAGMHHADEGHADEGPGTWSSAWRLHEAIERVQRRYDRRMQPYRAQLRRNPGVRPQGLVELERQRDDEIDAMIRDHNRVADADRAERSEPRRLNKARERQAQRAALQALAQELSGASRRYTPPTSAGRATGDIWRW